MVRASVTAEKAGFPAVSIASTGFLGQAQAVGQAQGIQSVAVAEYPGVIATDSDNDVIRKTKDILVNNVIRAMGKEVKQIPKPREPQRTDIIFEGSLDEVQEFLLPPVMV